MSDDLCHLWFWLCVVLSGGSGALDWFSVLVELCAHGVQELLLRNQQIEGSTNDNQSGERQPPVNDAILVCSKH